MKQQQKKIFKDGVAKHAIDVIFENIPNIMFVASLSIRAGIGVLLWMHADTLFSFIKNDKWRIILVTIFVVCAEVIFTTFSLASAKLRREAKKNKESITLLKWANTFFILTLLGSFCFNALMLYWTQHGGNTKHFNNVSHGVQLNIFIQVMNAFAVFTSEGSAFILNSNTETVQSEPVQGAKQNAPKQAWESVTDSDLSKRVRERLTVNHN